MVQGAVVLMRLHVMVSDIEGQVAAIDHDIFQNIRVAAASRDLIGWQVCYLCQRTKAIRMYGSRAPQRWVYFVGCQEYQVNRH